jgi:hypothetical protein
MTAAVGVNGPFATSLPIRSGDQAGLNAAPGAIIMNDIGAPSTALSWTIPMPLADGETREGAIVFNREVLVQATIEPTNTVAVGALTRNKKKGTAAVTVTVPNPGQLSYAGSGVSVTGPASVAAPGDVQLTVRATGKKAKKLKKKGKAGVSFGVTFTPDLGTAGITPETLTLRKKPKKKK